MDSLSPCSGWPQYLGLIKVVPSGPWSLETVERDHSMGIFLFIKSCLFQEVLLSTKVTEVIKCNRNSREMWAELP